MADADTRNTFARLGQQLKDVGMEALLQIDSAGNPSGWLWDQMQAGVDTPEELQSALQQTDVYRNRFSVIVEQQRRAAAGEAVYVMSPSEVLAYEKSSRELMQRAGMPATFYDRPEDFNKLILANISARELDERLSQAYEYVQAAPPEVRNAFRDYYGVQEGDQHLAAWALDPQRTLVDIERATRTAYTGGMAKRYDIQISREAAQRIQELPKNEQQINEGLQQIASQKELFEEGLFETANLTVEKEGIGSAFEADAGATKALERRVARRKSIDQSSIGGAALTNQGLVGAESV